MIFLTKKTEEYDHTHTNDYVSYYDHDVVYGERKSETDCNGYSTCYDNPDHLGLTVRSYKCDNDANHSRISGTETVTALRWIGGSAYQGYCEGLGYPYYFTWKRSSGGAEALTIYDAMGRELRTVSHGLPENGIGKIVYKDTQYDIWGRLHRVSEPYFKELPQEQRKWTTYTYGDFDRIDTLYGLEYTVDGQTIQPYTRYEYDGLTTTTTSGIVDGTETHVTATTLNVMGWTESNVEVIDENGTENTTTYGHNADGSLAWSMVNGNESTKISLTYDDAGNRRTLLDPNYGKVTDHYNAFGQLERTISPKGDTTAYEYDYLGRMKSRTETSLSNPAEPVRHTAWNYCEAPGKKGLLDSIVLKEGGNTTQSIAYAYERYNRLATKTETLNGTPYTTTFAYDDQNGHPLRLRATTYPTGFAVERGYDALTGRLHQMKHGSTVLWKTMSENALGQITRYTTGNGAVTQITYDDRHLAERQVTRAAAGNILQDFGYRYDIFANLAARKDNRRNLEETFTYDHLDRLTGISLTGVPTGHMAYDALGRMTDKRADGQTVFSSAQHDYVGPDGQRRPHAVSSAQVQGNPFPTERLDIDYTMFDKVKSMRYSSGGVNSFFLYGYDHQRIMYAALSSIETKTKVYAGNCEFVSEYAKSDRSFTYLSGPLGVFAVVEKENGVESLHYVLKDHLGSWTTITDANGTVEREQSFDPWGTMRNPDTWTGTVTQQPMFDRGFTGHEHVQYFGLINMNGRMYDPVMSSFLSVDNYVQAPDFSQSFNRYAYCLNNPLRYVDPSGEFLTWSINWHGFSIGLNFTPAGYPLGFGLNVSWANGGSVGLYGEVGYRVGGTGLGAGVGVQQSIDYGFATGWSTPTSVFGYGSLGCFSVGGSVGKDWVSNTAFWNVNVGIGLYYNSNMNAYYGGGLSIGYGSGGWTFGASGYYNRMQKRSIKVLSTAIVEGSDGLSPIGQEGEHGCLEAVYQWIAETYGMELSAEKKAQIAACIVQDKDGNWFLNSGNIFMDVIKSGHKPLGQEGYPNALMEMIYDEIEKGSRVVVNLAPMEERIGAYVYSIDDGHSIGIQSVSKMQKTNIWGNTTPYYSVKVMDPGMNGNNGGYKYISPYYIKSSQNMSVFYRIR